MTVTHSDFGTHDGRPVGLWTVTAQTALGQVAFCVTDFGATLQRVTLPDARGNPTDIALGYDTLAEYATGGSYFGAIAGRYANRIRGGHCTVAGAELHLTPNEGANHLHGGPEGFHRQIWDATPLPDGDGVALHLISPDGDMGYPGTLSLSVTYRITDTGALHVEMTGTTDRPTLCNPAQHSLWNLGGHAGAPVTDHIAHLSAGFYTPVDAGLIPTGEVASVLDTPFDFRAAKPIGRDLMAASDIGYDHNFVLGLPGADGLRDCARVLCPANGLGVVLRTTEPGVQFYTGGHMGADSPGKDGARYGPFSGFALETQKFPDSPNLAHFPQATLMPDARYHHRMTFDFFHEG
ncbi:aldose epimerase family protein [Roseicitreum antarcticum]|uniref:Aldose 1-epimerase n=1 Tax=Roseicitreum antarcticum TaxID=564137 RepID=A0A1H2Z6Y4_9RHOB|nr:aldose epimerase family protein [Roseicitreum antarcticum]SDX13096.1 aldose 1-epimerase [Roseicitreum antarcticum]